LIHRIVVVDDEAGPREFLAEVLQFEGHEVAAFGDAVAALRHLQEHHVDVIFSDLEMPGQDGRDLVVAAQRLAPHTPVIIVTGKSSVDAAVACLKAGAADFIAKPLKVDDLLALVARYGPREAGTGSTVHLSAPVHEVGPYRLERLLGRGRHGAVYLGRHREADGVPVAVKVLRDVPPEDQHKSRERFAREAETVAGLAHPNIVPILDFAVSPEVPVPYIAMEYVAGPSLQTELPRLQQWPVPDRLALLRQLAAALAAVHERGICHRDIKPANILLTPEDRPKLTDFGIARIEHSELTDSVLLGTPRYMAPEAFETAELGPEADLFALGVVAYELFTGEPPFQADSVPAIAHRIVFGLPRRPSLLQPEISPQLEAVLAGLLAKRREDRYRAAADLLADLEALPNPPKRATPGAEQAWDGPESA